MQLWTLVLSRFKWDEYFSDFRNAVKSSRPLRKLREEIVFKSTNPHCIIVLKHIFWSPYHVVSQNSSVSIVTWLCAVLFTVLIPTGGKRFVSSPECPFGLCPPQQSPVQWIPGALLPSGSNGQGVKLTIHFPLVLRLKITGTALPLALCAFVPSTGITLLWPSSWNCKSTMIRATDVLIFVYLLLSQRYRCFRCCDVYRRLSLVCHVLPEASWLCMTRLLVRIRVHALTVPLDCPLVAWEVVLNVEDLFLGHFDVIKVRCLRVWASSNWFLRLFVVANYIW
jgi:hypothetical protein